MAGRLTQAEIALLREEENKGRLTQTEIALLREEVHQGRLSQTELVLLREDEIPPLLTNEGGWGFIPFGTATTTDTSVYIDTYEDEY